jgi:hypothetical protein
MTHGTFEIIFYPSRLDIGCPLTAVYRPPRSANLAAQRAEGNFSYDEGTKKALADSHFDPRNYGLVLGRTVFGGAIRDLFTTALAARWDGQPLHVLLSLEWELLRKLRWERLLGPFGSEERMWDFLALSQRTTLAAYVAGATHQKFPPLGLVPSMFSSWSRRRKVPKTPHPLTSLEG